MFCVVACLSFIPSGLDILGFRLLQIFSFFICLFRFSFLLQSIINENSYLWRLL